MVGFQAAALQALDIRMDVQPPMTWNADLFASEVTSQNPDLIWEKVARGFDHPAFRLPSENSFKNLMNLWRQCTPEAFPLHAIMGEQLWQNTKGQAQLLKYAVAEDDRSIFTFEHAPGKKQKALESLGPGTWKVSGFRAWG